MALFRSGQYLCTAPLTAKSTVSDFLSNSFKGINRQWHYFRSGQYLCTAPLTAKSTVSDFLSNSFKGINRQWHFSFGAVPLFVTGQYPCLLLHISKLVSRKQFYQTFFNRCSLTAQHPAPLKTLIYHLTITVI